nr:unnamed protein product [Callosobruchus analis]
MYLYNLTLQHATAITHAVHGNFSGTKIQEIAISRGKTLELLRPDPNTGKVHTLLAIEIFGIVRSLMAFRLTGGTKDYVVVGSDSGRIVILEYLPQKNMFDKVHQETFGKSGCRRIVPGQYLATDPRGRAVMMGAIEKQKLAYILNRDAEARLTISSPLEAHKSNTLVYHMVGVDVGYDNPIFACLEIDYEEADSDPTGEAAQKTQQTLTFYELALNVNHVVRKYSEPLEEHANFLVTVPGGDDGPSGVLICSENYLTYKSKEDGDYFYVDEETASQIFNGEETEKENSRQVWSREEILSLLHLYKEFEGDFKKTTMKNEKVWRMIGEKLKSRTVDQIKNKFKYLKQKYTAKKDNMRDRSSGARAFHFEFFDEMNSIFGKADNIEPKYLASSFNGAKNCEHMKVGSNEQPSTSEPPKKKLKVALQEQ